MTVNKVILVGRLGKDPILRQTAQQMAVSTFSIATNERRRNQQGEWQDHTEWHNIVTFGTTAENCHRFLRKGKQVYIEGRITTRKWQDKEGRDRYTTEIIATNVRFLGSKGENIGSSEEAGSSVSNTNPVLNFPTTDETDVAKEYASFEDDEIPF